MKTSSDNVITRLFLSFLFGKISFMFPKRPPLALISACLLITLLVASCSTAGEADPYPTYDPFAPINGGNAPIPGGIIQPTDMPTGPTPTRAPLSIVLPPRNPGSSPSVPTPDPPHLLPAPRQVVDQYTVQPGDTLGRIAQQYGISLEALMQANGLNESSILSIGVVLNIPPVTADTNPGSSFKIIPNSELVYGPATIQFDLETYINSRGGYLADYLQEVNGEYLSGAQIVQRIAQNFSVNPRLLLALIEYRSGWVTNPAPSNIDYPLGYFEAYYAGLYRQLAWAADNLNRGYYSWRANAIATLSLSDGSYVPLDPTINAGTAGVQYLLAKYNNRASWDFDVGALGLFQTYNQLFGYPFDYDIASLLPPNLVQPPMQLPFEIGVTWSYTGGPHGGWDSGSGWAALDFAPPGEGGGCARSDAWVTAVANGLIVRSEDGAVVQDLDNDGYEQTGWTVLYLHIDAHERVQMGTYVYAGGRIGYPSCEGGFSNATHLHLARRYNGEWISADGNLPFNLDGWISSGDGVEYDGFLTRGGVTIEAWEGVFEGLNQIAR
jgi:LasA protease